MSELIVLYHLESPEMFNFFVGGQFQFGAVFNVVSGEHSLWIRAAVFIVMI